VAEIVEIAVYGMRCGHCELTVKHALEELQGVKKVKVRRSRKSALITLEPNRQVSVRDLIAAVNATGYRAEVVTASGT
jgi:copper chaperone CopZ